MPSCTVTGPKGAGSTRVPHVRTLHRSALPSSTQSIRGRKGGYKEPQAYSLITPDQGVKVNSRGPLPAPGSLRWKSGGTLAGPAWSTWPGPNRPPHSGGGRMPGQRAMPYEQQLLGLPCFLSAHFRVVLTLKLYGYWGESSEIKMVRLRGPAGSI